MNRSDLTILVTGGTGRQGGAVALHLLRDGWTVRALVRDPEKPAAQALARAGCELFVGDLTDRASLDAAVQDCHGVHSVQTPAGVGPEAEVQEGIDLADAAADAGVEHFVFDSVIGADREDGAPYQWPKHRIEEHIAKIGLPATIWRPVTFMENFLRHKDEILSGHLRAPVGPDVVRQFIAVDDIGAFVALAFREHDRFVGVTAEIASDEMTMPEVADLFSLELDIPVVFDEVGPPPGMAETRETPAGEAPPRRADLDTLREMLPDLWTLERWIGAQDWRA
jgi:uncharacterized protein YbjT (DUF2867 family)